MSLLSQITSGVKLKPLVQIFYGPNGVGKTTLAANFESVLILDLEDGSSFISGVSRLSSKDLSSFKVFTETVVEMFETSQFKTLVVDSLEALESLIHKEIIQLHKVKSIEDIPYGKGMVIAREMMEETMRLFQSLRDKMGLDIIIVAHSQVKTFTDPNGNVVYDRYLLRANDKLAGIVKDLADSVFFITFRVDTVREKGKEKVKAFGDGERVIYTQWRPSHDAKSRYLLPYEINFTLDTVKETVSRLKPQSLASLYEECLHLVSQVKDEDTRASATKNIEANKSDPSKLAQFKQRLIELI